MKNNPSSVAETLVNIASLKSQYPEIIGLNCFDEVWFKGLDAKLQQRLLDCMRSGIENPESEVGCYANYCDDYEDLAPYFSKVVARYHHVPPQSHHVSDWDLSKIPSSSLDLAYFSLPALSVRVRVARNLNGYPLPAAMSLDDRIRLENEMGGLLKQLSATAGLEGNYHSLTPGHPNEITTEQYQKLVADHLMFKSMEHDPFLNSAGISSNWPHGRGCYISNDQDFILWIGEEDHLRIMVMECTTDLSHVFNRLKLALDTIEQSGPKLAYSEKFGAITSCPTNLGTGMRASVHLQLPKLTAQHSQSELNDIARDLGLSIRGLGGEHTSYGTDGTVDISPRARYGITEVAIITTLYEGIGALNELETAA